MKRTTTAPITPRRQVAGGASGPSRPYPRFPPPKIMALLLDPRTGSKQFVFLRANKKGLTEIFGDTPVVFTNDYTAGYRVYHEDYQDAPEYDYFVRPDPATESYRGKVLLTGHGFKELRYQTGQTAMQNSRLFFGPCNNA